MSLPYLVGSPLGRHSNTSFTMLSSGLLYLYYPADIWLKSSAAQAGRIATGVVSLVSGDYFFRYASFLPLYRLVALPAPLTYLRLYITPPTQFIP
eukprot:4251786-Heterocapsa_arctica.AAC.1